MSKGDQKEIIAKVGGTVSTGIEMPSISAGGLISSPVRVKKKLFIFNLYYERFIVHFTMIDCCITIL